MNENKTFSALGLMDIPPILDEHLKNIREKLGSLADTAREINSYVAPYVGSGWGGAASTISSKQGKTNSTLNDLVGKMNTYISATLENEYQASSNVSSISHNLSEISDSINEICKY